MIVYIAGKYSGRDRKEVQANIDAAEEAGKRVLAMSHVPLIPHKLTSFWDEDPRFKHHDNKFWIESVCLPLLDRCDAIMMIPGWKDSPGAVMEYQHASTTNKRILFLDAESV